MSVSMRLRFVYGSYKTDQIPTPNGIQKENPYGDYGANDDDHEDEFSIFILVHYINCSYSLIDDVYVPVIAHKT